MSPQKNVDSFIFQLIKDTVKYKQKSKTYLIIPGYLGIITGLSMG